MPLNISETGTVRDRVGTARRSLPAPAILTWCIGVLALHGTGCQLLLDDLPPPKKVEAGLDASEPGTDASVPEDAASADAHDATLSADGASDAEPDLDADADAADTALPDLDAALLDADPNACDGAGPRVFFEDHDRDGYGNPRSFEIACSAPADYVSTGDDCDDDNDAVHPGQTGFFAEGRPLEGSDDLSFDYDCDGDETGRPDQVTASPQGCSGGVPCSGGGYLKGARRRVPRANDYCGSATILTCGIGVLLCGPTETPTDDAYSCR